MIINIKVKDIRERSWMPDKVINFILKEQLEIIGLQFEEATYERGPDEHPDKPEEGWDI